MDDFIRMKFLEMIVNDNLLLDLKALNIFQTRSGMKVGSQYTYINRLTPGEIIKFEKNTCIEEYTTFASGYSFHSSGSFSSLASSLPLGSRTGRYTSLAAGLTPMGYRHPIEAVCMNSAVFNFSRENIASYFKKYEKLNKPLQKNPVPTPQPQYQPIHIGHDVWIGANVTITGGLTIGDGAVIASNSVVTKNVAPYSVVAGNPAVHKKYRFPLEIVDEFKKIQWWEYELGDLYQEGLNFSNPSEFIERFYLNQNNIRKFHVRKFKPYSYLYYGLTDAELIFDHYHKVLCFHKKKHLVVKTNKKNRTLPPIILKKINGQSVLYVNDIGIMNISSILEFEITNNPRDINYQIIELTSDIGFVIKINHSYLSSKLDGSFTLSSEIKNSEKFYVV